VVRELTVTDAAAYFDLRRRAHETDPRARLQLRVAVACPEAIRLFERSGSSGATEAAGGVDDDLWMMLELPEEAA
jgi:hypothetical protein